MVPNPPPRPPSGPWRCVGLCALALGLGIFITAVFPVGALMFLVAFLLGLAVCADFRREKHEDHRLEITEGSLVAAAAHVWRQRRRITRVHYA